MGLKFTWRPRFLPLSVSLSGRYLPAAGCLPDLEPDGLDDAGRDGAARAARWALVILGSLPTTAGLGGLGRLPDGFQLGPPCRPGAGSVDRPGRRLRSGGRLASRYLSCLTFPQGKGVGSPELLKPTPGGGRVPT